MGKRTKERGKLFRKRRLLSLPPSSIYCDNVEARLHDPWMVEMRNAPWTLYEIALIATAEALGQNGDLHKPDDELRKYLTDDMTIDIFLEMSLNHKKLPFLAEQLSNPDKIIPLLQVGEKRVQLHQTFQSALDGGFRVDRKLTERVVHQLHDNTSMTFEEMLRKYKRCLNLSGFLAEAGWLDSSIKVLRALLESLDAFKAYLECPAQSKPAVELEALRVNCQALLLHCLAAFSMFEDADRLYNELLQWVREKYRLVAESNPSLLCELFSEFSYLHFLESHYNSSFAWAMEALRLLNSETPPKVKVDALRQACKASVVKRDFRKAEVLIKEALVIAVSVFGEVHPKYADCLSDFGFFLLNTDEVTKSLKAYRSALKIRLFVFGGDNLRVAFSNEDYGYALYVKEYNCGEFWEAKRHSERALEIMEKLLPNNHYLLSSAQRVLALILEEIAIDESIDNKSDAQTRLQQAEKLHLNALELSTRAFGELNVQTSKHYGNLGRLYQSMSLYGKAEEMHLKAIEIKETILGPEDYEVALSIGHLASLYNYDMHEYDKAEALYLRSIDIGIKLYGPAYSGLEYDYRGLIQVYLEKQRPDKAQEYQDRMSFWKELRRHQEQRCSSEDLLPIRKTSSKPLRQILQPVLANLDNNNLTNLFSASSLQ